MLAISDLDLSRLSIRIADELGLHYPPARWPDLARAMESASADLGFDDVSSCSQYLASGSISAGDLAILASHLTVGETYFFRDHAYFDRLEKDVLPHLIRARQQSRRLRIWSAGCCTGEEPYSIAIQLHQCLAERDQWNVSILATDIHPGFLRKAAEATFSAWSFRHCRPEIRRRYFQAVSPSQSKVIPAIRRMVTFAQLNLAQDVYPSPATDTQEIDLIFCRNVLLYFTPEQAINVLRRFHRTQPDDGILVLGASEPLIARDGPYHPVHERGTTFFRKSASSPSRSRKSPVAGKPTRPALKAKSTRSKSQRRSGALHPETAAPTTSPAAEARDLANRGQYAQALAACDRWIAFDKLNASGHYLRAVVLYELKKLPQAEQSLRRALYLDPDFIAAHLTLGRIAHETSRRRDAQRHFARATALLHRCHPGDIVPDTGEMTAARLATIVRGYLNRKAGQ